MDKGKPFPDIFLQATKQMKTAPKECLVIEDSLAGLKAAKAAGMKCIICPDNFYKTDQAKFKTANSIVKNLDEITIKMILLWFILIYSAQHLVRDILSDVFGIHNAFTEFLHRESSNAAWCYGFCKWTTFPVEIFYIFASLYLLKKKKFGVIGEIMAILVVLVLLQYLNLIIK